uniref:Ig-like domain-containing protein n=1 Tax=Periophthalmus magnuspinnatus TaxID=409849 RepID=A0A3B4BI75_9GOBI
LCKCKWLRQVSAKGPSDVHIHWLKNGHSADSPVMEYRRPLGQDHALVSSWLQEGPLIKDAKYKCLAEASTGNDMSEVSLQLPIGDEDTIPSKYLNNWKSALAEHGQLLKKWEKAWVCPCL